MMKSYLKFLLFFFSGLLSISLPAQESTKVPHQLRYPKAVAKIDIGERKTDPFGIPMKFGMKAVKQLIETPAPAPLVAPQPVITYHLRDALSQLTVTGVMPRSNKIMTKGRLLKVGETISLYYGNKIFRARLDDVAANVLIFTDVETGDKVSHPLRILPSFGR